MAMSTSPQSHLLANVRVGGGGEAEESPFLKLSPVEPLSVARSADNWSPTNISPLTTLLMSRINPYYPFSKLPNQDHPMPYQHFGLNTYLNSSPFPVPQHRYNDAFLRNFYHLMNPAVSKSPSSPVHSV